MLQKIKGNPYIITYVSIIGYFIAGYMTTISTNMAIRGIFMIVGLIGLISIVSIIVSVSKCDRNPIMFHLILKLLMMVLVFALEYSLIFSFDPKAFDMNSNGIPYLELLYFSFITFTSVGYGDVLPISYVAKFTSVAESFLFACVISFIVLNFSGNMKRHLAFHDENKKE